MAGYCSTIEFCHNDVPVQRSGNHSPVSSQVTDAVTQVNVKTIAEAPAMAMGVVYQMLGQAVGFTIQSSAFAQQQMQAVSLAVTSKIVEMIAKS
jgi:hypothetical protein